MIEQLERRQLLSTALAYGSVVNGNISNPAATVDFTFQATAGSTYTFGMTSTPTQAGFQALADLYSPSNIKTESFFATGQRTEHPTQTGTYTLKIHDSDFKQTGSFMLSLEGISPINPGATPLVSGGIVSGSINGPLDAKEYTFTGKSGDIVAFSSTSTPAEAGFTQEGEIFAPSGTRVGGFFAGGLQNFTLHETGTFMVEVHDSDFAQKGSFTIGLNGIKPISPGSTPLVVGGFVSGSITTPIGIKAYTFSGKTNDVILFSMTNTPTQAGFNALADIYSPSGTHFQSFFARDPFALTLNETGTFLVLVHDSDYVQSGSFSIGIEGVSPPSPDALALPAGQTLKGTIKVANDVNEYTFFAHANDQISFALTSTATQAGYTSFANIYSPAGVHVGSFVPAAAQKITTATTGVYMMTISDISYSHQGSYGITATWTSPISSSIFGSAYNDANGNGSRDAGELGIFGRTMFLDANNNGKLDSGERSTTTDVLGNYAFDSMVAGPYVVREVLPAGQRFTNPATGMLSFSLGVGQNATGKNFGTATAGATGSISGNVFNDGNGNGARDVGELGLGLWTVYIDANNNGVLDTGETKITTDINGNWSFKNLIAGTYVVRVVQPAGTVSTTPASGKLIVQLAAGQVLSNELFGEKSTS